MIVWRYVSTWNLDCGEGSSRRRSSIDSEDKIISRSTASHRDCLHLRNEGVKINWRYNFNRSIRDLKNSTGSLAVDCNSHMIASGPISECCQFSGVKNGRLCRSEDTMKSCRGDKKATVRSRIRFRNTDSLAVSPGTREANISQRTQNE